MAAKRGNRNAAGKRVKGGRIALHLSISEGNGLRPLFVEYLSSQGVEPTDEAIKEIAGTEAYRHWAEWLKRQIETNEQAIII